MSEPSTSTARNQDEPTLRKSRRINKQEGGVDDTYANYCEVKNSKASKYPDRGLQPPIGLGHTPFQFDRVLCRETENLQIEMHPNQASNVTLEWDGDKKTRQGEQFQCAIPEYQGKRDLSPTNPRESSIWTPPEGQFNLQTFQKVYWKTIWRQYEGHIPYSMALENLKRNGFDFGASLETIDEFLQKLPQELKPICLAQFIQVKYNRKRCRREIQAKALRNYHMGEVTNILHRIKSYRNLFFYKFCYHDSPMLDDLEYEPRWACSNCTKNLPNPPMIPEQLTCLVCKTYQKLRKTVRPAENPVFSEMDLERIQKWKAMEILMNGGHVSRQQFEESEKLELENRLMRLELTDEEKDMLFSTKGPFPKTKRLNERQKEQVGQFYVEQLVPHPIPHFIKCDCDNPDEGTEPIELSRVAQFKRVIRMIEKHHSYDEFFRFEPRTSDLIHGLIKPEQEVVEWMTKRILENVKMLKKKVAQNKKMVQPPNKKVKTGKCELRVL